MEDQPLVVREARATPCPPATRRPHHSRAHLRAGNRLFPPRLAVGLFIVASAIGFVVTAQVYLADRGARWSFLQVAAWQVPGWLFWAVAAPLIWRLARPIGLRGPGELRAVICIIASAIALDLSYILVHTAASFVAGIPRASFGSAYLGQLTTRFHYGLIIFGAILSGAYAVAYGRRLEASEFERLRTAEELAETRSSALRRQLQPHFLFNTLNTIAMLVREAGALRALDVVLHLSSLLRRVVRESESGATTLREEFSFLSHYLEIERIRFEDRLSVAMVVAPDAADAIVPAMLLQPLVENALQHGVGRMVNGGAVRVSAVRDGSRLQLTVSDNGPGFDPSVPSSTRGLGLSLVRRRLAQEFREDFRLELQSTRDGPRGTGTTVLIDLPYREARATAGSQPGSDPV